VIATLFAGLIVMCFIFLAITYLVGPKLPMVEKLVLVAYSLSNLFGALAVALDSGIVIFRRELQSRHIEMESARLRESDSAPMTAGAGNWNRSARTGAQLAAINQNEE